MHVRDLALATIVLVTTACAPALGYARGAEGGPGAAVPPSALQTAVVYPTFTIHFDNDASGFSRFNEAETAKIDAAARYILDQGPVRLRISGYTDTAGSSANNQRISMARARAVADRLIFLAVPADHVEIIGYGETRQAVATADNVSEPRNRRVEIQIGRLE